MWRSDKQLACNSGDPYLTIASMLKSIESMSGPCDALSHSFLLNIEHTLEVEDLLLLF